MLSHDTCYIRSWILPVQISIEDECMLACVRYSHSQIFEKVMQSSLVRTRPGEESRRSDRFKASSPPQGTVSRTASPTVGDTIDLVQFGEDIDKID